MTCKVQVLTDCFLVLWYSFRNEEWYFVCSDPPSHSICLEQDYPCCYNGYPDCCSNHGAYHILVKKNKTNAFIMNHVKLQYVLTKVLGSGTNQHYWIISENVGIKMEYNIIIWEGYKLLLSKIHNKVLILTCFDLFLLLIFWFKESLSKKPDGVDKPQKWKKSKPS